MTSSYRQELDRWLAELDVKAERVLDIGGSQQTVKGRTKSWDVKQYYIADLPDPHKQKHDVDIELDLNKQYSWDWPETVKSVPTNMMFDLIFCLEVFEYVYDPMTALYNIRQLLQSKCSAWVSFMSIYPIHEPIEDDALRYMPGGIAKLAKANGLNVGRIIERKWHTEAWHNLIVAEGLRASRNNHHYCSGYIVELIG